MSDIIESKTEILKEYSHLNQDVVITILKISNNTTLDRLRK